MRASAIQINVLKMFLLRFKLMRLLGSRQPAYCSSFPYHKTTKIRNSRLRTSYLPRVPNQFKFRGKTSPLEYFGSTICSLVYFRSLRRNYSLLNSNCEQSRDIKSFAIFYLLKIANETMEKSSKLDFCDCKKFNLYYLCM